MRIRELRKQAGMTQAQLAQAVGVGQSDISRIESGQRQVTVPQLCAIAMALKVHPAELLPMPAAA